VNAPTKLDTILRVSQVMSVLVQMTAKFIIKHLYDGIVCHANSNSGVIAHMAFANLFEDSSKAFAVKQASNVTIIQDSTPSGVNRMAANSEKTRCPALNECGRATPSQASRDKLLGVCNEHVLSSEEKICSELYRNVEKLAEMTNSANVLITYKYVKSVTDCNTKYIHWRPHSRRNMVPLDPDRFSVNSWPHAKATLH